MNNRNTTVRGERETSQTPTPVRVERIEHNGSPDLPAVSERRSRRRNAWAGEVFQQLVGERDDFQREVVTLKTTIAARDVEIEAMRSRLTDVESRITSAVLERDQAVADRAVYETLFVSVQAQMRAFKVPAAPLVTGGDDDQ